jgi:4-hydroxy-tetrahydrodipicolinate synthase
MHAARPAGLDSDFSGLWIPLVTPFQNNHELDLAALKRLIDHYKGSGIKGFVVCGSTGEAAALSDKEQIAVLETVKAQADGLRVIMGLSGYHLGKTAAWVSKIGTMGIDGILVPAPSYIRPSQAGIIEWFTALADVSTVPVIVYDIPSRTGSRIELETMLALAAHPKICAIKDCSGDTAKVRALIADGRLQMLAGDDANIFDTIARGGQGAIAAATHLHTQRFVEVMQLIGAGDLARARSLWEPLLPLIDAVFAEPNPGPVKALLAQQGLISNDLRSPMTRVSAALEERLKRLVMLD